MLYVLIAIQLADIATTHYALRTGIDTEANPLLRKMFDRFGHEPVLLAIKGGFIALLVWLEQYLTNDILLKHEGGFSDHPADPGGKTRFGITEQVALWRMEQQGKIAGRIFRPMVDLLFRPIEKDHCYRAWLSEVQRSQLPSGYRG